MSASSPITRLIAGIIRPAVLAILQEQSQQARERRRQREKASAERDAMIESIAASIREHRKTSAATSGGICPETIHRIRRDILGVDEQTIRDDPLGEDVATDLQRLLLNHEKPIPLSVLELALALRERT